MDHRKFAATLVGAPSDRHTASRIQPNPWAGLPGLLDGPERDALGLASAGSSPEVRRVRHLPYCSSISGGTTLDRSRSARLHPQEVPEPGEREKCYGIERARRW